MRRDLILSLLICLMFWLAAPAHAATTTCSYDFTSGHGNTYLSYCVTANGNILEIQTPFAEIMSGSNGEGYGLCDQNIQAGGRDYVDYAVLDTGNWNNAIVLSHSSTSVKIARTTADGNWTLTQTITMVPRTFSITVVMALKNNQAVADVAYLVRFADVEPPSPDFTDLWIGNLNSAVARGFENDPNYGLQLANVGIPPFSFWEGFAQSVNSGPNACAFAFNEGNSNNTTPPSNSWAGFGGSIEMVYVGSIGAGLTKTITLSYHGL